VEKQEGKRPLGRPRCRWVNNIKMDLRKRGWGGMDRTDLAQDRDQWRAIVNTVINLRVPKNIEKFLSSCTTGCFSRRNRLHGVYGTLIYTTPSVFCVFFKYTFIIIVSFLFINYVKETVETPLLNKRIIKLSVNLFVYLLEWLWALALRPP
jgi:hypothetical protein